MTHGHICNKSVLWIHRGCAGSMTHGHVCNKSVLWIHRRVCREQGWAGVREIEEEMER